MEETNNIQLGIMADEVIKEKIYCSPCQNNDALIGALMSQNKGCDASTMMAMMNNNGWNNNPFIWLVFLAWMNGGYGFGGNRADVAQNADLSRQLQTLQGTVADNHNNDLALAAINGNRDAMGQLAQTFNTDITAIQTAICGVKSAIEQVGGQVGYTSESVKNAIAMGDASIVSKMQDCCCQNKQLIQQMGYEGQIRDLQNTASINTNIEGTRQAVVNGFANLGYQNSQNTAAIIQNATANTQRILDQMCSNTTQELRDKLAQMSQEAQTQTIINQLKSGCNCGC